MSESNFETKPICYHFYVRRPAEGGYRYKSVHVAGPEGDGLLHTLHPPLIGDHIRLWDSLEKEAYVGRVIARQWMHSSWGSQNWPYNERQPLAGPLLDVIVEPDRGMFVDEAFVDDEEDD